MLDAKTARERVEYKFNLNKIVEIVGKMIQEQVDKKQTSLTIGKAFFDRSEKGPEEVERYIKEKGYKILKTKDSVKISW